MPYSPNIFELLSKNKGIKLFRRGKVANCCIQNKNIPSIIKGKYGTKYSRMDQVKFVEGSFLKI